MALWKMAYGSESKFAIDVPSRFLDLAGLIAIATAPAFVLLVLIPLPLVPPVLSILSFAMACGAALYALFTKAGRDAQGVTVWDIAGAFALVWITAGIASNPRRLLDWFDNLPMMP
jgi:hypothetical protein